MLRNVLRSSLALLALIALTGCAVERITGPRVDAGGADQARVVARGYGERHIPPRDDPGGDPTPVGEFTEPITSGADTLWAGGDQK